MNTNQLLKVIWEKSRLNLKSEAAINYLSYIWWLIEPILHMLVYYLVFESLLKRGGPGYVFLLLSGLVPWLWFSKVISQGSNSLVTGRALMSQLAIPKLFFPLVIVTQCSVKQVLVFAILILFLLFSGHSPSVHWLSLLPIILLQLLLMAPMACLLAVALVYVRDLSFIIPTVLQFMFFCTGIFFSLDDIGGEYLRLFYLNPMAGLVQQYREVLLNNAWPEWMYLGKLGIAVIILWVITLYVYRTKEYSITRAAQE